MIKGEQVPQCEHWEAPSAPGPWGKCPSWKQGSCSLRRGCVRDHSLLWASAQAPSPALEPTWWLLFAHWGLLPHREGLGSQQVTPHRASERPELQRAQHTRACGVSFLAPQVHCSWV